MENEVLSGIMGLCVADALGVPVEFYTREELKKNPVQGMRGYGTHMQPLGTWSDDSSMTFCLMDSLIKGLDYNDIMDNFSYWLLDGKYTPHGEVFDVGITTNKALMNYGRGMDPIYCGGSTEEDNGNGALMRILPITFYLSAFYGDGMQKIEEQLDLVHKVASLTHGHMRNQMACGIYIMIAKNLSTKMSKIHAVESGIYNTIKYYRENENYAKELKAFERLEGLNKFAELPEKEIKSSGYVIDTLEAAIWCLLNTNSYRECVLKAVNLGGDTDTIGAVAGGLAGILYSYYNIPEEWKQELVKRKEVEELCDSYRKSLLRRGVERLSKYIPFFETATKENCYNWEETEEAFEIEDNAVLSNYNYGQTLRSFLNKFYQTNLSCYTYLDVIKECKIDLLEDLTLKIQQEDEIVVRSIMTYYIRQEKFYDGLMMIAIKNKVFLSCIKRLEKLYKE